MSSLQTRAAQQDRGQGYFVPVSNLVGQVYAYSGTSAAGASGSFSTAQWAYYGAGLGLSSINAAGAGILKDMGRTVVSSSRTFRKVQVVLNKQTVNANASTFGVGGQAGTTYPAGGDYLTGYIEMGFDGVGTPAPVAAFGR